MATKIGSNLDLQNASKIVNVPTPTSGGDAVNKTYVDGLISTSLKPPTGLDASTNPNYPASTAGDTYLITVAGKVGGSSGQVVNVGDLVVCQTTSAGGDEASVGSDFFILESNRDQATETVKGVARLATQSEVNTGTDAETIVTPVTLQTKLTNTINNNTYTTAIGNGTDTTFSITHSLNSSAVHVIVRETTLPGQFIITDISIVDANNVSVSFVNPPTTNQYTVVIKK
jgi:alpha-D-ribose 1-methylphosphonate 5-triphosphate synthase subunit PhnG